MVIRSPCRSTFATRVFAFFQSCYRLALKVLECFLVVTNIQTVQNRRIYRGDLGPFNSLDHLIHKTLLYHSTSTKETLHPSIMSSNASENSAPSRDTSPPTNSHATSESQVNYQKLRDDCMHFIDHLLEMLTEDEKEKSRSEPEK